MANNEGASRCGSETEEEENLETSAFAPIGRNEEMSDANIRNARPDPGVLGGRGGEVCRQSGTNDSVTHGEGDVIPFGEDQAESCRVEQTQSSKDNELEVSSTPEDRDAPGNDQVEYDKGACPTVSKGSGNRGKDREAVDDHQDRNQPVKESEAERKSSITVCVLNAEDLAGANSTTIFGMPKRSQTLRRYIRVRISCLREGQDHRIAGQTSSVAVTGSTCCWGDEETRGEKIRLPTSKNDSDFVLEMEVCSDQSGNSGEDLVLGHGKIDVREFEDSHSQWVGLDPKGRVEVWISTSASHLEGEGAEQPNKIAYEGIYGDERDERDGPRNPLSADDQSNVAVSAQAEPTEVSPQKTPTSPKWGRSLLPDFKNVLMIAGGGRASHQKVKQPQAALMNMSNRKSGGASSQVDFPPEDGEDVSQERRERVTCEKKPYNEHIAQAHQLSRSAKQGVQQMKDSFQSRLLGARGGGKRPDKNRGEGTEGTMVTDLLDGSLDVSVSLVTSDTLKRAHSEPSDVEWEQDEQGTYQAQTDQENNRTRISDEPKGGSSDEGDADRRQSSNESPHRFLVQDETADDKTQRGEGRERDGNGASNDSDANDDSNLGVSFRRNNAGDQRKPVSKQARNLAAQIASPLDAIMSVTAAASRLKSTWSSRDLTSTLKGLRRKKSKGDANTDVASSPDLADVVSPGGPLGADQASATATYHKLRNVFTSLPPEPVAVRVTIFRASLPEALAIRKFGGTNHRTVFVRLKIGDASSPTSAVQAEGRECRWETGDEGEIVDIPTPSPNLPDFAASILVLEVWNKSSKELGEELLMGKTEVVVSDWLGKKGWAELYGIHQGGRVKLGVTLKFSASNGEVSDNALAAYLDAFEDKESRAGEDTGLANTDPNTIRTSAADVGDTPQQMEETSRQNEIDTESIENASHQGKQASRKAGQGSRSNEGANLGGSPVERRSFSTKNRQSTSSRTISPNVSLGLEGRKIEAATSAADHPGFYADAAKGRCVRETGDKSNFLQKQGVKVCTSNAGEQELLEAVYRNEKMSPISSDALEGGPSERRHREGPKMNRTGNMCIDLAHSTSSGASTAASRIEVSGANMTGASTSLGLSDSHEQTEKSARQAIVLTKPNDAARTTSSDKRPTAQGIPPAEHVEMPGRLACGGTATALNVADAWCTRDQQAEVKSTEADINTTFPREDRDKSHQGHHKTYLAPGGNGIDRQTNKGVEKGRCAVTEQVQEIAMKATIKGPDAQIEDAHHVTAPAQITKTRIDRARDIVRRRRQAVCSNRCFAPVDHQSTSGAAMVAVQARAATTIQGAFRGRTARRTIRLDRRSVVKIQAAYRGHMDRKEYVSQIVRARRAKAEETRARARRSRIAFVTQELHLLRGTPARQLLRLDTFRYRACATRIQRVWRRYSGQDTRDKAKNAETQDHHSPITAGEMGRSGRNPRVPVSDMAFATLQLRVKNRRQAGEHFKGRELLSLKSTIQRPRGTEGDRRANERLEAKTMLHWHDKASQLTAVFHQRRIQRHLAAKRRSERLVRFRKIQDELLRPTKLYRQDRSGACADYYEMEEPAHSRAPCVAEEQPRRDRARRTRDLALAAGKSRKDRVFAPLLERAKATSTRRKEHAERGERQHQLFVSRNRRIAIDEVIHQQQVASCQNLSYMRKRETQEQRSAATVIQSYIRRFLGRKQALSLRTKTKILGALQILVNELRQPELDPDYTLAAIPIDRSNGCHKKERGECRASRSRRLS